MMSSDLDECQAGMSYCQKEAECENFDGSFECHCNKEGYVGDGEYMCSGECSIIIYSYIIN